MGGGLFLAAWLFLSQLSYGQSNVPVESSEQNLNAIADQQIFESDPLANIIPGPGSEKLSVRIRFISHGVKIKKEMLERFILTTEKIYDTCEGVDFKIINEGIVPTSKTLIQEKLTTAVNGSLFVTENFFNFFGPASNSKAQWVIDVHLVDFLTENAREDVKNGRTIGERFEGQGFSQLTHAFGDSRPLANQNPPLSFFEDNIVLAHDTVKDTEGEHGRYYAEGSGPFPNQPHKYKKVWKSYANYLLAHELGHILMDRLTPDGYKDHYCPGIGMHCTKDYLMSAGGFNYNVFYNPAKQKQVIGYGPTPLIDRQQCENLKAHPLVLR